MAQKNDKIIILVFIGIALFFCIFFAIVVFAVSRSSSAFVVRGFGGSVAQIDVTGAIRESEDIVRQIRKYQDDGSIKALVLRIDSPGGGVAASQEIYEQLVRFKKKGKPIVVSMGEVAASGGYYIACTADTIFASPGTVTGSIGVILSFPVFENLMDKVGIKMEVVKSGALKDVGDPGHRMTPQEQKMLQSVIDDTYGQFVSIVSENRDLDSSYVRSLADGSIFTGRQALEKGLVDKLGTLDDAIAAAGEMTDLGTKPRVVKERRYRRTWVDLLGDLLGIDIDRAMHVNPWPSLEYRYCQ
jgi:protease-4